MKRMKDYYYLYLKWDILLLTDVFEKFRNNSLKSYGLYPSPCFSAPGLNWNTMLGAQWKKLNLNLFQVFTCLYSLRKVQEVKLFIFLTIIEKPVINI